MCVYLVVERLSDLAVDDDDKAIHLIYIEYEKYIIQLLCVSA